jgi:hypothetical protein
MSVPRSTAIDARGEGAPQEQGVGAGDDARHHLSAVRQEHVGVVVGPRRVLVQREHVERVGDVEVAGPQHIVQRLPDALEEDPRLAQLQPPRGRDEGGRGTHNIHRT